MTPVTLPKRPGTTSREPETIEARTGRSRTAGTAGSVTVTPGDSRVTVRWTCGATRSFTPEDLQFTLENLERMQPFADVVFVDKDSSGTTFYARIVDGRLYVNDTVLVGDMDGVQHVPWLTFRRAILRAIGTKEAKAQARKQPEPIDEAEWRRQNE